MTASPFVYATGRLEQCQRVGLRKPRCTSASGGWDICGGSACSWLC